MAIDCTRACGVQRAHAPAAAVSFPAREVAAGGAVAYNLWRNVDLCLAGGYGMAGDFGAAGVTLAIE